MMKSTLTEREVERRYNEALKDFGPVFSEPNRKPIWLFFNAGSVAPEASYDFDASRSNTISFPLAASIGENVIREVIKSWLRDGIEYRGVNRPIARDPGVH